jgi:hypothetical protein
MSYTPSFSLKDAFAPPFHEYQNYQYTPNQGSQPTGQYSSNHESYHHNAYNNSSPNNKFIPVFDRNSPNAGSPQPVIISPDTPVYSAYTSNLIGYGPIKWNTPNDAPEGNKQYKGTYHGIIYTKIDNTYMAHRCTGNDSPDNDDNNVNYTYSNNNRTSEDCSDIPYSEHKQTSNYNTFTFTFPNSNSTQSSEKIYYDDIKSITSEVSYKSEYSSTETKYYYGTTKIFTVTPGKNTILLNDNKSYILNISKTDTEICINNKAYKIIVIPDKLIETLEKTHL